MATVEQMYAAVHGYVAAFSAGDAEQVVALFAPDATVEDPVGSDVLHGHEAIRAFYVRSMSMGAKLFLDEPIRAVADTAAFAFHVLVEGPGMIMHIDVIDLFRFNDAGKVTSMKAYWGPQNMRQTTPAG